MWMKINVCIWCFSFVFFFHCRIYHRSSVTKKTYPNICSCQYSESTIISYCSRSVNLCLHICQCFPFLYIAFCIHTNTHAQIFRLTNVVAVAYDSCCCCCLFAHGVLIHDITTYFQIITHIRSSDLIRSFFFAYFWLNDTLLIISHFNFLCL